MNKNEIIERGEKLAARYGVDELKDALKTVIAVGDNEERLALQWALKRKTGETDGYSFTKEQGEALKAKLPV